MALDFFRVFIKDSPFQLYLKPLLVLCKLKNNILATDSHKLLYIDNTYYTVL